MVSGDGLQQSGHLNFEDSCFGPGSFYLASKMAMGFLPFIPGLQTYPTVCQLLQMVLGLQAKLYPDSYQKYHEGIACGLAPCRKSSLA